MGRGQGPDRIVSDVTHDAGADLVRVGLATLGGKQQSLCLDPDASLSQTSRLLYGTVQLISVGTPGIETHGYLLLCGLLPASDHGAPFATATEGEGRIAEGLIRNICSADLPEERFRLSEFA
jgi:hypothetical protein